MPPQQALAPTCWTLALCLLLAFSSATALLLPSAPGVRTSSTMAASPPAAAADGEIPRVTVLGFGSLLSERSSRLTFPNLTGFRLGTVPGHRRVFCHPASIFFERGIANIGTLEISSLSAEKADGCSFVCSVFEVPGGELLEDPGGGEEEGGEGSGSFVPSRAFLEREEEFEIVRVPYLERGEAEAVGAGPKMGVLCRRSTDAAYAARWGRERFERKYGTHGLKTIWGWGTESGIRPCGPYLRHCVLAAGAMGTGCLDSFLDETYLADRTTPIREYLAAHPEVMETVPPGDLAVRYGG